ncbi:MAG: energy transducer TonB [Betaproteobacteria bacterium]|nr:energy transducer TonB [Betaproteobacteria bacterium]
MEYAFRKSTPQASAIRVGLVVALHAFLAYGLMHGLQRVDVKKVLEDMTVVFVPLPPVIEKPVELPRKVVAKAVDVPVVKPPDIVIDAPPPVETVAVAVQSKPAEAGPGIPVAGTDAGTAPAAGLATACPNAQAVRNAVRYPLAARRDGLEGDVVARFVVGANGAIRDITIASSSNRVFNSTVTQAVAQFACTGQGRDVAVEVPFSFRLN